MAISDYPLQEVPEGVECRCPDEQAHEIAALCESGMGQREASLQVWAAAEREERRASLSASIRASFLKRWTDLRLPETGAAS